jgi:glycosyltransferase involved in cell wall biosynthesis
VKILVLPQEDANPYQRLLYGEMRRQGVRAEYLGRLTPSHTLNLVLLPVELACRRLAGWQVVHLHWVFGFRLPGAERSQAIRRLSQHWFNAVLRCLSILGIRLVWTAHNVLPHGAVFADDVAARQRLVAASDLVIAHSDATLAELATLGATPRRAVVIPHGPFQPSAPASSLRVPGAEEGVRRILFFGKIQAYKGVENLVRAFLALPDRTRLHLTVVGECSDQSMRATLALLAGQSGGDIILRLERLPDSEITSLFEGADMVALPFRRVTTSGSAILALCHGRPLILPDLPSLAEFPADAVIRYDGSVQGLTVALTRVGAADRDLLRAMSAAAREYCARLGWADVASRTITEMAKLWT